MMCPLFSTSVVDLNSSDRTLITCVDQDCAWWDNYRDTCVVKILGVELRAVAMAIREASGHIPPIE